MADNTNNNDNRLNMLGKAHNDKLDNPATVPEFVVYMSMALSVIIPVAYFVLCIYPTIMAHNEAKQQLAAITLLTQKLEQLKKLYKDNQAILLDLEAETSVPSEHATGAKQYNSIDLHRLAHQHQLTTVAMNTLKDQQISPRLANHFTAHHLSWHLRGHFLDYLGFRNALWEKQPLLQVIHEQLSTEENLKLDIVVDLNIYRPIDVALEESRDVPH